MITRRLQYELIKHVGGPFLMELQGLSKRLKGRRGLRPDSPFGPPLQSIGKLKDLMMRHYLEGRYADGAVPVAWVTSGSSAVDPSATAEQFHRPGHVFPLRYQRFLQVRGDAVAVKEFLHPSKQTVMGDAQLGSDLAQFC